MQIIKQRNEQKKTNNDAFSLLTKTEEGYDGRIYNLDKFDI